MVIISSILERDDAHGEILANTSGKPKYLSHDIIKPTK